MCVLRHVKKMKSIVLICKNNSSKSFLEVISIENYFKQSGNELYFDGSAFLRVSHIYYG